MIHSCKCSCGNISITGRVLSTLEIPKQLENGAIMVGSAKCGAFAIKPQAIEIKDMEKSNIHCGSNNVCTVTCRTCCQSIQFIDSERCGYAVFLKVPKAIRRSSTPADESGLSPNLQKYIKPADIVDEDSFYGENESQNPQEEVESDDEVEFPDDGDFEIMFSGKTDPFIGSFQDHFIHQPARAILI